MSLLSYVNTSTTMFPFSSYAFSYKNRDLWRNEYNLRVRYSIFFLVTPDPHEDGEEDGGVVVEDIRQLRVEASLPQVLVITQVVARGTHHRLAHSILIANIITKNKHEGFIPFSSVGQAWNGPHLGSSYGMLATPYTKMKKPTIAAGMSAAV